jgi:HK97 family phage major capsid protein
VRAVPLNTSLGSVEVPPLIRRLRFCPDGDGFSIRSRLKDIAMTETTAANPELLVEQVSQLLVQPVEAASVVLASGARIFDTASVLRIPKLVFGATVGFIGEAGLIPDDSDVDFTELILMPIDRKRLKTILRFTNELVRQSVIGIDAVPQTPPR